MVGDVVVEASQDKIGGLAEGVHVVGTFDLVHNPRSEDVTVFIRFGVLGRFHVVGHKKGKKQKQGLGQVH